MVEFKQILCPVDLSEPSVHALDRALAVAQWYDARLTVLHVVPDSGYVAGELGAPVQIVNPIDPAQVVEDVRRSLDLETKAPDANLVTKAGDASTTIVDEALSTKADLIVMGTHGRRGFKRLLLGSVTETVLRDAPCPVLTVPPAAQASPSAVTFNRILCPVDYSPSALQAFGFALDLARQAHGRITLLHVVEWLAEDEPRTRAHFNVPEYRRYLAADAEERLGHLIADESQISVEIDKVVVFGRAHREIIRAAETNPADLIVMGAQGRGGVGLALFGSTTQQVVRSAACPVLTVRGSQPV